MATMTDAELFQNALDNAARRMWMAVGTLGGVVNPPVDAPRMIVSGDTMSDIMDKLELAIRRHERVRVLSELEDQPVAELLAETKEATSA